MNTPRTAIIVEVDDEYSKDDDNSRGGRGGLFGGPI